MDSATVSMIPTKFTVNDAISRVETCIYNLRKGWFENPDYEVTEQPHQMHGIEWALYKEHGYFKNSSGELISQKRCGMICDEMGLGKTTVAIGTIIANYQR